MANETTFRIRIETTGEQGVKNVTLNTHELGKAVDAVSDKSQRLDNTLVNLNQRFEVFRNAFDGFQQAASEIKKLTEAFSVQEQAELRLEVIMRQRMQASEESIQSIKDFASAQQELGVVGDEVQLAGAQQMATFLNEKSSLEALIPAMNNLAVQQNGLNVSQESMVSIGNMMGKAMQGQTAVLQRVGITFTDAQEKVLKYGNEQQRAAMLAQVITDNVGNMNEALAKTDAGKAKQLANTIGDYYEMAGKWFASIEPAITAMSELGMSIFAVVNAGRGLQTIVGAIQSMTIVTQISNISAQAGAMVHKALGAAYISESVAAGVATVATKALQAALTLGLSVAITAIVAAIGKLVGWLIDLASSEDKTTNATDAMAKKHEEAARQMRQVNDRVAGAKAKIDTLTTTIHNNNAKIEDRRKAIKELQRIIPDYHAQISKSGKLFNENASAITRYVNHLTQAARAEAAYAEIVKLESDNLRREAVINDAKTKQQKALTNIMNEEADGNKGSERWQKNIGYASEFNNRIEQQGNIIEQNNRKIKEYAKSVQAAGDWKATLQQADAFAGSSLPDDKKDGRKTPGKEPKPKEWEKMRVARLDTSRVAEDTGEVHRTVTEIMAEPVPINLKAPQIGSELQEVYDTASAEINRLLNAVDIGAVSADKAQKMVDYINATLQKLQLKPITVDVKAEMKQQKRDKLMGDIQKQWGNVSGMVGGINQMTRALNGNGTAWEKASGAIEGFIETMQGIEGIITLIKSLSATQQAAAAVDTATTGVEVANSSAKSNANVTEAMTEATKQGAKMTFPANIAAIAAGVAAVVAAIGMIGSIGKFADGGIAYGPTLGLFGEYAGASSNPEVVAPLDKLRSLIGGQGGGGNVSVRMVVRGKDLVGVLSNQTRIASKSGKRTGIII